METLFYINSKWQQKFLAKRLCFLAICQKQNKEIIAIKQNLKLQVFIKEKNIYQNMDFINHTIWWRYISWNSKLA